MAHLLSALTDRYGIGIEDIDDVRLWVDVQPDPAAEISVRVRTTHGAQVLNVWLGVPPASLGGAR